MTKIWGTASGAGPSARYQVQEWYPSLVFGVRSADRVCQIKASTYGRAALSAAELAPALEGAAERQLVGVLQVAADR